MLQVVESESMMAVLSRPEVPTFLHVLIQIDISPRTIIDISSPLIIFLLLKVEGVVQLGYENPVCHSAG